MSKVCRWCGKTNQRSHENNCSTKCDLEEKESKAARRASGETSGAVDWDKSLLGGTINLIGKGVKAGVNKASEYNTNERANQKRNSKRQEEENRNEISKQKSARYRAEGKIFKALINDTMNFLGF